MEKIYKDRFNDRLELHEKDLDIHMVFEKRSSGSLQIFLGDEVESIRLHMKAEEYSYIKIFMQNHSKTHTKLIIHSDIYKDAKIRFGLLDMIDATEELEFKSELLEQGADMELYTGQLCLKDARKNNNLEINHHSPYTYGNMHNFAVMFDEGFYDTVAAGRIEKGCFNSESHQETRVLTMGKDHTAKVIPILYIDENDVKASHALTIGQPDASQLYYLQSRGLSKAQAIGLLSIGYFMPVIDLIDDKELHENLRMEMEKRVGLYGH